MRTNTVVVAVALLSAVVAGCAKRPATSAASAPAPTGAAGGTAAVAAAPPAGGQPRPAAARGDLPTGAPAGGGVAARPRPGEFHPVPELKEIHFDFDRYDIRPGDAAILDANAAWLKQNDLLVLIEGHADERGTNAYNLALGERRAKAAMNHLVAQGVAASRITIISYGEERPVCTAHEEACWARNRRARFLVRPR
jgi:peptidoglycan-associated lipoprotein